jgi:hypothetical protein
MILQREKKNELATRLENTTTKELSTRGITEDE